MDRDPVEQLASRSVGLFEMHSSEWSNGIRYQIFDTRPDIEFKKPFCFAVMYWSGRWFVSDAKSSMSNGPYLIFKAVKG